MLTDEQLAAIAARVARNYSISSLDVRALLDEVRALRAERDRYKAALEEIEALGTIESMRQTEIAARALAGGVQGAAE